MFRCVDLRLSGIVQGVNLRAAVCEYAIRQGLRGTVKNELDGAVRIVAEGERRTLERLIDWLRSNPGISRIQNIDVQWRGATNAYPTFTIFS